MIHYFKNMFYLLISLFTTITDFMKDDDDYFNNLSFEDRILIRKAVDELIKNWDGKPIDVQLSNEKITIVIPNL